MRLLALLLVLLGAAPAALAQAPAALDAARTALLREDYRAAADTLEAAGRDAVGRDGRLLLARAYGGLLQYERVADVLAGADTSDVPAQLLLGRALLELGQTRDALPHFETAYRQDSTDAAVGAALAGLLADLSAWDDVRAIYARLLAEDDENAVLHTRLGTAYRMLDSTDAAIVHLEIARRLNPRAVGTILGLTGVYYGDDKLVSARRVIDQALADVPEEPRIWDRCGDIALKEEQYERAVECFDRVLALGDTTALGLRKYGVALYLDDAVDSSRTVLEWSFARDTTDAMTSFYLGLAHLNGSEPDFERSLYYLDVATAAMGQGLIAEVHAHRAAAFDRSDRDAEAIRAYRLVHTLNPAKHEALFHIAALYDTYYRDRSTALEGYEAFLAAVADAPEDRYKDLRGIAERRASELREEAFFRQGLPAESAPADSAGE